MYGFFCGVDLVLGLLSRVWVCAKGDHKSIEKRKAMQSPRVLKLADQIAPIHHSTETTKYQNYPIYLSTFNFSNFKNTKILNASPVITIPISPVKQSI